MKKGYTAQEVTAGQYRGCRLLLLTLAFLLALPAIGAGEVLVIGDTSRPYFQTFAASLDASYHPDSVDVTIIDTKKVDSVPLDDGVYHCIVTVGNDAARRISEKKVHLPVLHALVTESFAHGLYPAVNDQHQPPVLLIDQPISRLILLAHSSMPGRHKLGVLYGPYSVKYQEEVREQAAKAGLQLTEKEINDPSQLGDVMSSFNGIDFLLTLPDPVVVNEGTAKTLILGAYMRNIPLVGYSQALVKAGALMSVHSTPEQLGEQSGELLGAILGDDSSRKKGFIYPRYYHVSVNYQVAGALQIYLPSEDELIRRLEKLEEAR